MSGPGAFFTRPWDSQPQEEARVDWDNPLTRGLTFLYNGATGRDVLDRVRFTGSRVIAPSSVGIGQYAFAAGTGSTLLAINPTVIQTPRVTVFCLFVPTADPGNNGTIIQRRMGSSTPSWALGVHTGSQNGYRFQLNGVTADYAVSPTVDIGSLPKRPVVLALTYDGDSLRLYVNGVDIGGGSGYGAIDYSRSDEGLTIFDGSIWSNALGVLPLAGTFDRALTASEVRALSWSPQAPWQLFEPRRIFVPVAAAGGATSLTLADATHGHTADSLTLTTSTALSIADAGHVHSADELTLTTSTALVAADASHAHAADALTLSTAATLVVADAAHAHAADPLTLTTASALAVADATHAHTADSLTLSATGSATLAADDATHGHAADSPALTTVSSLAVADAAHGHSADNVTLSPAGVVLLVVADATHAHATDGLDLSTAATVLIADALHGHSADGLSLTVAAWLAANDAAHGHSADNATLIAGGGTVAAGDVWNYVLANGKTAGETLAENNEMLRIVMAAVAGTSAGVGTDTETYFGIDGTTPRVIATFDGQGNRTSVTTDGTDP